MTAGADRLADAAIGSGEGLEAVAEVVEAGDGLPALARAIGRALETIVARGTELGADLADGAGVLVARAHPLVPEEGDWRARVALAVGRGARRAARGSLAGWVELHGAPELAVLVPNTEPDSVRRAV